MQWEMLDHVDCIAVLLSNGASLFVSFFYELGVYTKGLGGCQVVEGIFRVTNDGSPFVMQKAAHARSSWDGGNKGEDVCIRCFDYSYNYSLPAAHGFSGE